MATDFSSINLQYLLAVRDLARSNPGLASAVLGLSRGLAGLLAHASAGQLAWLAKLRAPLLVVRGDSRWWGRLLASLESGSAAEVEAVLAHFPLLATL